MSPPILVAALYVDVRRGPYAAMEGVECWGEERDARLYPGPHPVVAHPPCQRWGTFSTGGLRAGRGAPLLVTGDDGGCFAAALAAVRRWGGVLEHPSRSKAWAYHGLRNPLPIGWWSADLLGGWTCCVEQGHYGHPAPKPTWLYAVGVDPPSLEWGPSGATGRMMWDRRFNQGAAATAIPERLRHLTPGPFAALLVAMARSTR